MIGALLGFRILPGDHLQLLVKRYLVLVAA